MSFKVVFIDDNLKKGLREPFVNSIKKLRPEIEPSVFINPEEGLSFVLENMNNRMIVLVDCRFDGYGLQGINILKQIREKTSLLYIVMMSANNLSQIAGVDLVEMINQDYIWFLDRNNSTVQDACKLIDAISALWDSRFDCVLEHWLIRHQEDKDKVVYNKNNKVYTWGQLLDEVRKQTEVGKDFERVMNQYCISKFKLEE
jgi:hypothetical protein